MGSAVANGANRNADARRIYIVVSFPRDIDGYGHVCPPSDVWAMACVCVEMSEFKPPFPCSSQIGMLFKIFETFGTPTVEEWPQFHAFPRHRAGLFPRSLVTRACNGALI